MLSLKEPPPDVIDAGADFSLTIASAGSPAELAGAPFTILEAGHVRLEGELPAGDTPEITLTAPEQLGTFEWTLAVADASLTFSFTTRPHATSLAVWGHPSPVTSGEAFGLHVGARCTSACALSGKAIEVHDETDAKVADGILGDTPWPGTTALYWTCVEVTAPAATGTFRWSVAFSPAEVRLPHGGASAAFSFVAAPAPEHGVSVKVVDKRTDAPLADAHVRLGVYRTATDEAGVATFAVPPGEYTLFVWKAGYEAPECAVRVTGDECVRVEAAAMPPENPDAFWQG
jgi:hypothetical protein